jgi:hypothetical protein
MLVHAMIGSGAGAAVTGCEAQIDGDYRGAPIARLVGRVTSQADALPAEAAIALAWETEGGAELSGTFVPLEPRFPAEYSIELYQVPPEEHLHYQSDTASGMQIAEGSLLLVDPAQLSLGDSGALPREAVLASVDSLRRTLRLVYATESGEVNGVHWDAGYQVATEEIVGDPAGPCVAECVEEWIGRAVSEAFACCMCALTLEARIVSVDEASFDLAIASDLSWFDPWTAGWGNQVERVCSEELGEEPQEFDRTRQRPGLGARPPP